MGIVNDLRLFIKQYSLKTTFVEFILVNGFQVFIAHHFINQRTMLQIQAVNYLKKSRWKELTSIVFLNIGDYLCVSNINNMTSFFRFVNKRAIYPFGIISLTHAPVNVTDFSIGSINCNPNNADRGRSIIRVT